MCVSACARACVRVGAKVCLCVILDWCAGGGGGGGF